MENDKMTDDTLRIIKQKDDWKFTCEIKDNAKGEPSVTIKTRSDESATDTVDEAILEYNRAKKELGIKAE